MEIMKKQNGSKYIVFGDEKRKYEFSESLFKNNLYTHKCAFRYQYINQLEHKFELRANDSPNNIIEFELIVPQFAEYTDEATKKHMGDTPFRWKINVVTSVDRNGEVDISGIDDPTGERSRINVPETEVIVLHDPTDAEIFAAGVKHAQTEITKMLNENKDPLKMKELHHLYSCLDDVADNFAQDEVVDFTQAVEQILNSDWAKPITGI